MFLNRTGANTYSIGSGDVSDAEWVFVAPHLFHRLSAGRACHPGERAGATPARGAGRGPAGGTAESGELVSFDRGRAGNEAGADVASYGIRPDVASRPEARRGFDLPPRRRLAEPSDGRMPRCHRMARDDARLGATLEGAQDVALRLLMLQGAAALFRWS